MPLALLEVTRGVFKELCKSLIKFSVRSIKYLEFARDGITFDLPRTLQWNALLNTTRDLW